MRVGLATFHAPKSGNAPEEYEDASSPDEAPAGDVERFRAAVADGATESMLSGPWARELTETWCDVGGPAQREDAPPRFVRLAQRGFAGWRVEYLEGRAARAKPVQWFEEPGLEAGAFATFLGLDLAERGRGEGAWTAYAIGDCGLFHLRGGALARAFPIGSSAEFGSTPDLVGSRDDRAAEGTARAQALAGTFAPGDVFALATDAVAAWLLKEDEEGRPPWATLAKLRQGDRDAFLAEVAGARADGRMRNDDVTLLLVRVEGST